MSESINIEDTVKRVMSELKDFQIATVERIDNRFRQRKKRVLVSDEVGLGKTLVARGTIAKFAKLRQEEGNNLIKVVYICSNATIAEQNIEKLRIVNNISVENADTSRLSMQHLNIFLQENDEKVLNKFIQIIPLTPQTSFNKNSLGTVNERALIYAILKRIPVLMEFSKELKEIFRGNIKRIEKWEERIDFWENQVIKCNKKSNKEYMDYMTDELLKKSHEIHEIIDLCKNIQHNYDEDFKNEKSSIIKKFRLIFADISLNKLNPDLIIMDEFQRFRFLLESDKKSDMHKLISKFFDMADTRILMLSATPYKMYSTLDEIYEDEVNSHYSEFLEVIRFLKGPEEFNIFEEIWHNYSIQLKEFNKDNSSFIKVKNYAEDKLYENICRTERISENQLSELVEYNNVINMKVSKEDIQSYIEAQKLLDSLNLNINVPIDYIKSTPYIMSFMNDYQLKKKIEGYFYENPEMDINIMDKQTFWLNESQIENYDEISYNNARLNNLMVHVLKDNSEKLLWIPPSISYYPLKGVFEHIEHFSKTLIFSSWEMVPRMISSLVSYEVERKTFGKLKENDNINYFAENRHLLPTIRYNQMSVFTLLYPSVFLIDVYNPKECLNKKLSLEEIENDIKIKIEQGLEKISYKDSEQVDERWYYLAPLLLDQIEYSDLVDNWFKDINELIYDKFKDKNSFKSRLDSLQNQYDYYYLKELGKKPDDLVDVLCDMAIGSPSICAYRLFKNEFETDLLIKSYNKCSIEIGRSFINFMNLPESLAILDLIYGSSNAVWKDVLKYSKEGNLQAVLEEYVYLIPKGIYDTDEELLEKIKNILLSSFNLRTTNYEFDTFESFKSRVSGKDNSKKMLRSHFAVAFTKGKSD